MTRLLPQLRRWIGLVLLAAFVAAGCLVLSDWQWHRRQARVAANQLVESNYDRAPVPLGDVLHTNGTPLDDSRVWTPVRVHGEYVPAATTLVRNRPLDSQAGFSVLVPFRADDGRVLVVNRGYLSTGETSDGPSHLPAPPSGGVTVVARLQAAESTTGQQAPAGQTYRINPEALAADLAARSEGAFSSDHIVTGGYGILADEQPSVPDAPALLPKPDLDEGPHLSYSVQWVIFAIGAVGGVIVVIRRTLEDERAEKALAAGEPVEPKQRRRPRRTSDEDEEDALLDAAEAGRDP